jgi:hypothetical protein
MYACISVQYGGDVGLAITQATGLTGMLQWGIRQMAEMENQMTSVERVLEYTAVQSEPPLDSAPGKLCCLDLLTNEMKRRPLTIVLYCSLFNDLLVIFAMCH